MIWIAVLTGIGGTALMTLFLYLLDYGLGAKRLKVVKVLGTMLTHQTTANKGLSDKPEAIFIGIAGHYIVGILFALAFVMLVYFGYVQFTYLNGAVFGLLAGFVGVEIWRMYLRFHSDPPVLALHLYFPAILLGHIILGVGIIFTYNLLHWMMIVISETSLMV